jgi:hypothetical protein
VYVSALARDSLLTKPSLLIREINSATLLIRVCSVFSSGVNLVIPNMSVPYSLNILSVPEAQATVMSPPLGVTGIPVAVSILAINRDVAGVPVS